MCAALNSNEVTDGESIAEVFGLITNCFSF